MMGYAVPVRAQPTNHPKEGMPMPEEILIGDVITTRKPHPCGSSEWTVIRTGADIKIRCSGCGRIVMMDRETFLRRRKSVLSRGTPQSCQ
jgi:hypothetical protein